MLVFQIAAHCFGNMHIMVVLATDMFLAVGTFPHPTHALQYHQGQILLDKFDVHGLPGVLMSNHEVHY